ncbi:hypothetical protein CK203_032228 [Vitis vinifera]|uniref:Reverse transcriptase domain-containing protein n=1 Tax=Vitis vinifera TaxID=29760 RepID=A0A438IPC0_VITVI|nr:hypothetical protein CK203_032228 [Vitis vinifera]
MSQNAFVEGWQIMDIVLITNEAIDSILKSNRGAILCKLDIEKAYDYVDWSFLLAVLEKMGFGEKWCSWIKWCLSTVRFSVLENGSPAGFFQSSRGLRQGDLLSPYLFVVVMEAFSCLLKRVVAGGLKMNMEKSELIPVGRVENVEELTDEFGYKVGILPSTYLGMPLGAPFKSVNAWDGIEERFRKRLAMWKRQYISKGGRITLIRRALLGKWVWRFANEKRALWNQVIRRKYEEERGGWRSCEARESYGVGDGKNVSFWKDKWCGTTPFCEAFRSLFAIATSKEAWVNEVWTAEGEKRGSWTPSFNRPFNDWEMEVGRLLCCLDGKMVRVDEEDRVRWMESKDEPKISFFA